MEAEITVEAQAGCCSDHHQRYYPQVPLLRDRLFAALKGKEEHTLFNSQAKYPGPAEPRFCKCYFQSSLASWRVLSTSS